MVLNHTLSLKCAPTPLTQCVSILFSFYLHSHTFSKFNDRMALICSSSGRVYQVLQLSSLTSPGRRHWITRSLCSAVTSPNWRWMGSWMQVTHFTSKQNMLWYRATMDSPQYWKRSLLLTRTTCRMCRLFWEDCTLEVLVWLWCKFKVIINQMFLIHYDVQGCIRTCVLLIYRSMLYHLSIPISTDGVCARACMHLLQFHPEPACLASVAPQLHQALCHILYMAFDLRVVNSPWSQAAQSDTDWESKWCKSL